MSTQEKRSPEEISVAGDLDETMVFRLGTPLKGVYVRLAAELSEAEGKRISVGHVLRLVLVDYAKRLRRSLKAD